jgi:hypothetical protein
MYLVGVLVALIFACYGISKYRKGSWSKLDLLLTLLLSIGVAAVSVFPPTIGNILMAAFQVQNRPFAILVFSNLLLFGMFFYLLNQVRASNRRTGELVRALAKRDYDERYAAKRKPRDDNHADKGEMLIIIPAYNEQEAIRGVLTQMPKEVLGYKVNTLVVVDGATDATEAVAIEHNFPVATHIVNRGQGDALRTGFEIARAEGAEIVVSVDADGQHQPEEIERLVSPIIEDTADLVVGSRFLGHYEERGSIRHIGIVLFSWLVSLLAGTKVTDCTNGFRAIRVDGLQRLNLQEEQLLATELILEAAKRKLRYREVPVSILRRAIGESKKPKRLRYPLGILRAIIQAWLR